MRQIGTGGNIIVFILLLIISIGFTASFFIGSLLINPVIAPISTLPILMVFICTLILQWKTQRVCIDQTGITFANILGKERKHPIADIKKIGILWLSIGYVQLNSGNKYLFQVPMNKTPSIFRGFNSMQNYIDELNDYVRKVKKNE